MDANKIVSLEKPVLCIDTCSLLDIMRDPTRKPSRVNERQAAIELVSLAESGDIIILMAQQVKLEFQEHDLPIQGEAKRKLKDSIEQIERVNQIANIFGASGEINLDHLKGHVERTRTILERWLQTMHIVTPSSTIPQKAFTRMNAGRAPAKRGKDSSKDCLIYETYIEIISELRCIGSDTSIVFLSSNTEEYMDDKRTLKDDIKMDFSKLNIKYTPNMAAAKFELGV